MSNYQTELSYRKTAVEGASVIGLTIALYDTLAGDLRRATDALRRDDIETRCREVNHALTVLAHLESWIHGASSEDLAGSLGVFYSYLRAKMAEAQVTKSAEIMEEQMRLVLEVRAAWQQLEASMTAEKGRAGVGEPVAAVLAAPSIASQEQPSASRWSA
ncbi:MAG TPA: flagellar export chaperone FliS [Acidisarcina sp.]